MDCIQAVHLLTLILMESLYLYIEDGVWIDVHILHLLKVVS